MRPVTGQVPSPVTSDMLATRWTRRVCCMLLVLSGELATYATHATHEVSKSLSRKRCQEAKRPSLTKLELKSISPRRCSCSQVYLSVSKCISKCQMFQLHGEECSPGEDRPKEVGMQHVQRHHQSLTWPRKRQSSKNQCHIGTPHGQGEMHEEVARHSMTAKGLDLKASCETEKHWD